MPATELGLHPGGNEKPQKCWEQEEPGSRMWLESCLWQGSGKKGGCGKQAGVSGFSLTSTRKPDLRGIRESKQEDFVTVRAQGWLPREIGQHSS